MLISSPVGAAIVAHLGAAGAGSGGEGGPGMIGRELLCIEDVQAANELYARVFNYRDPSFALNPNLIFALKENGGSVVGVFTPEHRLVGFAYGFAARDSAGLDYHYSQATVVDSAYQGMGLGRQLKCLQRRVAQRWGHRSMRWTFDPLLVRNGHFNFSTLGAIGTRYISDYYGRPGTDRLLVEWSLGDGPDPYGSLRESSPPTLDRSCWGEAVEHEGATWVPLPAESREAQPLRPLLARTLRAQFAKDRVMINCRRIDADTTAYLLVPRAVHEPVSMSDTSPHALSQEQS